MHSIFRTLLAVLTATVLTTAFAQASEFFNEADLQRDLGYMQMTPEGPADMPWIQAIDPTYIDTSEFAKDGPWTVCFSNAGVNNPWRVVGFTTMEAEVDLHPNIEQLHPHRRRRLRQQADQRHQRPAGQRRLRHPHRLAQHHRRADAGHRDRLRAAAGHRLRPRRQHRLPGHLHHPHRRLRLRRHRGRLHRRQPARGRQRPGPAHPARRRRARVPLVRRRAHLRRGRPQRRGRRVHRGLDRQHQVDRRGLPAALRQHRRHLDGRRRDRRRRHRGVRGLRRAVPDHHRRRPAGLPAQVARRGPHGHRPDLPHLPVAHPDHRRRDDPHAASRCPSAGPCRSPSSPPRTSTATSSPTCRCCTTRCAAAKTCPTSPSAGAVAEVRSTPTCAPPLRGRRTPRKATP